MAKKQEAIKRALGTLEYTLGFEIMNFLQDRDVNEIIVNPDTKIWVDTFSKGRVLTDYTLDSGKSEQIIYQVADLTIPAAQGYRSCGRGDSEHRWL